jgi:hypothetical protein
MFWLKGRSEARVCWVVRGALAGLQSRQYSTRLGRVFIHFPKEIKFFDFPQKTIIPVATKKNSGLKA